MLGLDSYQIEDGTKLNIFEPNKVDLSLLRLPIKWETTRSYSFDYAQYAFIYDKNKLIHQRA